MSAPGNPINVADVSTDSERPSADSASEHSRGDEMPLGGYPVLSTTFVAGVVGSVVAAKGARGGLPHRYSPWDLVTAGTATHKISRMLTKDRVASVIRTPFVENQERAGHGEVSGQPSRQRGPARGWRIARPAPIASVSGLPPGSASAWSRRRTSPVWSPSSTAHRQSAISCSWPIAPQRTRSTRRRHPTSSTGRNVLPHRQRPSRVLISGGSSPAAARLRLTNSRSWSEVGRHRYGDSNPGFRTENPAS